MAHSFWFIDELCIKNLSINKRNNGGHYIVTMLLQLAASFQMFEAMLPQFALMLHAAKLVCFEWSF